jgi:hypothetical protein
MSWKKHIITFLAVAVLSNCVVYGEDRDLDEEIMLWRDRVAADIDLWRPLLVGVYDAVAFPWHLGGE